MPLEPERFLDTRTGIGAPKTPVCPGCTIEVQITGRNRVPPGGVTAVVANITGTGATAAGFVTVWPSLTPRPNTSTINLEYEGHTVPNLAVVPLGSNGKISMFTERGTDLIVDVVGYLTAGSQPGLFVPVAPARLMDSRQPASATADGLFQATGILNAGTTTALRVTGRGGVPANASATIINVTVTGAQATGYITVWPCGTPQPNASNLNYVTGDTIPNAVLTKIGADGTVCLYSDAATHVIIDVFGYYTP